MPAAQTSERAFRASGGGQSQNQKLAQIFLAHPNEWLSMTQLGSQIGAWAVHSRVSFLRRKHGMNIESDVQREEGVKTVRVSQYRYVPPQ